MNPRADPSVADFRLQAGSPAINAADTMSAPTPDLAGVSRPQGPTNDLGAYEYSGSTKVITPFFTASPSVNGYAIMVYDLLGRQVYSNANGPIVPDDKVLCIPRKMLPAGLYMLRATDMAGKKIVKLVRW
ncbi:MAG: T9SS type A sorting domain-containing protein [Chitinivibrionales bacterium]|nr:T9SS type A sorting domain-containing protein [Chitinivibrionales bacterium]